MSLSSTPPRYVVVAGDAVASIAQKFGTTPMAIVAANPQKRAVGAGMRMQFASLVPGEAIWLPSARRYGVAGVGDPATGQVVPPLSYANLAASSDWLRQNGRPCMPGWWSDPYSSVCLPPHSVSASAIANWTYDPLTYQWISPLAAIFLFAHRTRSASSVITAALPSPALPSPAPVDTSRWLRQQGRPCPPGWFSDTMSDVCVPPGQWFVTPTQTSPSGLAGPDNLVTVSPDVVYDPVSGYQFTPVAAHFLFVRRAQLRAAQLAHQAVRPTLHPRLVPAARRYGVAGVGRVGVGDVICPDGSNRDLSPFSSTFGSCVDSSGNVVASSPPPATTGGGGPIQTGGGAAVDVVNKITGCPTNYFKDATGSCQLICPDGQQDDGLGNCVPIPPAPPANGPPIAITPTVVTTHVTPSGGNVTHTTTTLLAPPSGSPPPNTNPTTKPPTSMVPWLIGAAALAAGVAIFAVHPKLADTRAVVKGHAARAGRNAVTHGRRVAARRR